MNRKNHHNELELLGQCAIRLHDNGPRVIFEFLADIARGRDFAETVADFSRIDPAIYAALCARMATGGLS